MQIFFPVHWAHPSSENITPRWRCLNNTLGSPKWTVEPNDKLPARLNPYVGKKVQRRFVFSNRCSIRAFPPRGLFDPRLGPFSKQVVVLEGGPHRDVVIFPTGRNCVKENAVGTRLAPARVRTQRYPQFPVRLNAMRLTSSRTQMLLPFNRV